MTAVANKRISWRLGPKDNQLIVLGFLLGIMDLCLGSVAPALFLLLEARFGLQLLGEKTGGSLFSNATLPFAVATSQQNNSEPPLPTHAQAYGFSVLLLNNESAAMLDIPQPSYISAIQTMLAGGESMNITAPVLATVATYNHSRSRDPDKYGSYFESFCDDAMQNSGAYTHMLMMNEWSIVLLNHTSPGNQTLQHIGLTPDPGIEHTPLCSDFFPYARLYDVNR
ncbi:MAG: hypothetical protein Q9166_007007 [cf. Caloplaca sp. 2 TL-2023]